MLEMIALGAPLPEILTALVRVIEAQSLKLLCTVRLLDADGAHLRHGAAPSGHHQRLIEVATHIAAVDIGRAQPQAALRAKTEELDHYFDANLDLRCIAATGDYFRRLSLISRNRYNFG